MSDLTEVYNGIKRLQVTTISTLRELLQDEYSVEWSSKGIDVLSIEKTISRKLQILIDLELIKKEKSGRSNIYSIIHNFPVKSKAPEIIDNLKSIFKEDEFLYAKIQKPIVDLLNEIKSPYYIRQNAEDISSKENILMKLEQAINDNSYINILYHGKNYIVRPIKIAEFEGIWYLLLFYDADESYRKYRIIETASVEILKNKFKLTKEQKLNVDHWHNVWHQPGIKPTLVKLWISQEVVKYFYQKNIFDINSYPNRVLPCSDGIEYDIYITHAFEVLSQIMYWQPHVIVLKQEGEVDLQDEFKYALEQTIEKQTSINQK